ncbi:thermonuclease family protein [Thalassospira sp.]|uniref:thermonuclease family protein n=1 Tax=Thalassospira sp. TaxID=1912094 RepID=UPI0027350267|nr:thermonuclease family protein [Thalassospira sp.]MDP2699890.1 thermonuclease family protein [Thalassospira sp.]
MGAGTSHAAECHAWPLRESRGGYAYDGDTIYIRMPGLPASIADMSVRVAGIDTPEIRGTCDAEKSRAIQARDRVRDLLDQAVQSGTPILFCDPQWGRYGGRVVASVAIGGGWLHDLMIGEGLARAYDGGKREGWCGAPE